MTIVPPGATSRTRRRPRMRRVLVAALVCALSIPVVALAAALDRDALWKVVHRLCVPNKTHFQLPLPCSVVDLQNGEERGWAILNFFVGRTQFLVVPTRRITGIEDPLVGSEALPNYWQAAWAARDLVARNLGKTALPRDDIGMAINGAGKRGQDQLHIHVDCIRADVRMALNRRISEIGDKWGDFRLLGHRYRARRVFGEEPKPDPFQLLAEDKQSSPLRDNSLAVFGASSSSGKPGFIVLAERAPNGKARAEDLLDHSCAVAEQAAKSERS